MTPKPQDVHHLASKLAQLLSDTVLNAHPHVAEFNESMREHFRAKFLDGLEEHTAKLVNPLLKSVGDVTTIPPEFTALLEELGLPTEQFTGIISQFFIFGVMFTLAQTMLAPFVQQVANDVWTAHPDRPLSPPDIATAVVRGFSLGDSGGTTVPDWAVTEAAKSGLDAETLSTMIGVTGMAPALQLLFEMVRRQIIPEGELDGGGETLISGIQQSDIRDPWIPYVSKLRYVQPTPLDLVAAAVRNQTDEAQPGVDLSYWLNWATTLGLEPADYLDGNPNWFQMLYNISGRPPGPVEVGHAANRGLIPWKGRGSTALTFEQAIAESDIKDKWEPLLEQLAIYWPPNGEVRTLLLHGGIDAATALAYWKANGVPDELAKAYLYISQIEQVTQDKALAKGDILTLVQENVIDDEDALKMLAEIGYSGDNAASLVEMAHFRYELEALRTSIRTVSTLYTSRKITATQATEGFEGLGLPASQIAQLLATLTHQLEAETVIPTAGQVASGFFYGVIDQDTAEEMLEQLGYDPFSAWFVLSVRAHGPLPNAPEGYVPPSAPPTETASSSTSSTTSTTASSS